MKSRRATSRPSVRGAPAVQLQPKPFGCANVTTSVAAVLNIQHDSIVIHLPSTQGSHLSPHRGFSPILVCRLEASDAVKGGPAMRCQQFHQATSRPVSPFQDLIVRRCSRSVGAGRGIARSGATSCDCGGDSLALCIVAPNSDRRQRLIRASCCAACLTPRTGVSRM